jgi:glycosyltransferase involved in cell wall biosynthesis
MADWPLVSVVIPTHNRTDLLMSRSLPSVLNQTYPNLEVLVVGDGTEPQTGKALRALADPRVRFKNLPRQVLPDDPGQRWCVIGLEARNWGHDNAQGEFIAGLDDDDEFLPFMIQTLFDELCAADADLAYGRSKAFGHDGSIAWYGHWPPGHFAFCDGAWLSKHDLGFRYDPGCISRGLPEDGDRIDRMVAAKKKFVFVDQIVHYYYPNPR